ncbi:TfuA-like protein [Corallococcus sp. AB011P]|uniref:TfuA-like protein n=1 Tax=Corallococcus sp. AB011P TaxID=2316735 RepID=UPI0018F58ABE|nr:TfuA-like protein [Corallococcus sp. AB011P]
MAIYVFVGPTFPVAEARAELDAIYLPPAAQGDVYRACLNEPQAIGIIDGYFERVPSIWHKEILWAMAQGIHVYGSASMGALRAAELHPFGMEGVGAIFEAFQRGELEDDDEVAVVHASAEDGYRPLSDAMVNIRATLAKAVAQGVISADSQGALERMAKSLHYVERSYGVLLAQASGWGLPSSELDALRAFLPEGKVDQKRADARAMLRLMREQLPRQGPKRIDYAFAHTDAWEQVRKQATPRGAAPVRRERDAMSAPVLEELRVAGAFDSARTGAFVRALVLAEARRQGRSVDPRTLQAEAEAFRRERGLLEARATEEWMRAQKLSVEGFWELMLEEVLLRWAYQTLAPALTSCLPSHLRASGDYAALAERAERKQRILDERGLCSPSLEDTGLTEDLLCRWYFSERLGQPVPSNLDDHARAIGWADASALRRAMLREYCYQKLSQCAGG